MKIKLNSVMVDDQDKALKFYTEVLGFVRFSLGSRSSSMSAGPSGDTTVQIYQV